MESISTSPLSASATNALIFSSSLVKHLDSSSALRLPSTYIGVRRIRPTDKVLESKRRKRGLDDDDDVWVPTDDVIVDAKKDGALLEAVDTNADEVVESTKKCTNLGANQSTNTNNNNNDNSNYNPREISYKITNPDGTTRRMTTQEKRKLKYELKKAKHDARKEERQVEHEERIQEAKLGKRERKRAKYLARKNRRNNDNNNHQNQKQEENENENKQNNQQLKEEEEKGGVGKKCSVNVQTETNQKEISGNNNAQKAKEMRKDDEHQLSTTSYVFKASEEQFDEELAALRGSRRGIPPVMLTPAATRLAIDIGALPLLQQEASSPSPSTNMHNLGGLDTIMDSDLSAQWAEQLQQSMVYAEVLRGKEDMRPMAYRLVPEVWKRLCPESLWASNEGKGEGRVGEQMANKVVDVGKVEAASKKEVDDQSQQQAISNGQQQHQQQPHSLTLLRNPSPAYDEDAYAIFRHLHKHSQLHVADGALFGCNFLLYDGSRDDRHSFAGIRIYSSSRRGSSNGSNNNGNGNHGNGEAKFKFPLPSAYDMTGFVRSMNTARKIALVATVIRDDADNVARVVLVDLALEKVLTALTHIRKGNTVARKTEEDFACAR